MERLFYTSPAQDWNNALPLGNGRLGSMTFGYPGHEIIQLNEESIWSGFELDRNNPDSLKAIPKIRELLKQNEIEKAQELVFEAMSGNPFTERVYQTAGEINLEFYTEKTSGLQGPLPNRNNNFDDVTGYIRSLDISTAICNIEFDSNKLTYQRESFISAINDVFILHLTCKNTKNENTNGISFRANLDRGIWVDRIWNYTKDTIAFEDKTHGIPYVIMAKAISKTGTITTRGGCLVVENSDEVTILIDIRTAYKSHKNNTEDNRIDECYKNIEKAAKQLKTKGYEYIKNEHIKDYQKYYDRFHLFIGEQNTDLEALPTDERLNRFITIANETKNEKIPQSIDDGLIQLYSNFCRYLLISCSRKNTLPATLQGLWNKDMDPPWGCKYTININTEMNYWPANICNLSEMEEPLFDLLSVAYPNGKKTAKIMYGSKGYVSHHNFDIFGDTAPQDCWLPGTYWILGAAWIATHIREHFEYTRDLSFLQKNYYLMHDACLFFSSYLTEDKDGYLIINPSVSPENSYKLPNGQVGAICAGCEMDNRILEHLFSSTISSLSDLQQNKLSIILPESLNDKRTQKDFIKDCNLFTKILPKLRPPVIQSNGTIREWNQELEEIEPGHRHVSQLYGLFPGHTITVEKTPEYAKAASQTLKRRLSYGGGHTGWSRAWIINFRASLHQGNEALKNIHALLASSTLPNLFDNHPPFQIDGNFGSLAGITRMIVDSSMNDETVDIYLLQALPDTWKTGFLHGVCVKGNLSVNVDWKDGEVTDYTITKLSAQSCKTINLYIKNKKVKSLTI